MPRRSKGPRLYHRQQGREAVWVIREARQLLIEFVGGEPGKQLRDQFA